MVLGDPVAVIAEPVGEPREVERVGERVGARRARGDGGLVEHAEAHHAHDTQSRLDAHVHLAASGYTPGMARSVTTPARVSMSRRRRLLWSPVAVLLVLLMAAGSVVMWIGLPLGLIWLASALTDSSQPSMGPTC